MLMMLSACGGPDSLQSDGPAGIENPGIDSPGIVIDDDEAGARPPAVIEKTLPAGFTPSVRAPEQAWDYPKTQPAAGGYRLLGPIADFNADAENSCVNVLRGIVRDFDHGHVDFGGGNSVVQGLVAPQVGEDRKPVPTGVAPGTAGALADWYQNGAGGNVPYVVDFWLEPQDDGSFVFDSSRFFPVEGVGVLSGDDNDGVTRNFGFTTEIHTAFEYKGGEVFNFRGDDDVFVFINGVLAVDLGGVHDALEASIALDTFAAANGLVIGSVYSLDLFHAERNPTGSNFRIDTTLDFKECAILQSDLILK